MQSSLRLGRVAGIDIGINWSWLIVFGLIVWSLAAAVFPAQNPGLSDGTHLAMAVVAALLFFVSLLLHELGHAIQARRDGMAISGITLWLFGGVARFEGRFPSAAAELRIAAAGPAVSLVLGIGLTALAWLAGLPSAVDGVVAWLGYINLILLAFNLLPALPLDGGRLLRATLWSRRGDFLSATRTAAALGRGFGMFLIVAGLLAFFVTGAFGGAWLAFIGWFLLGAAEAEGQAAVTHSLLGGLRVRDVMVDRPVTARPDMSLRAFVDDLFAEHRHTAYPVVDDGRAVGLISFRALAPLPPERWDTATVREHMEPVGRAMVAGPDDALGETFARLRSDGVNRALVCADGRLTGLLSITDVVRMLELRGFEHEDATGVAGAAAADAPRPGPPRDVGRQPA